MLAYYEKNNLDYTISFARFPWNSVLTSLPHYKSTVKDDIKLHWEKPFNFYLFVLICVCMRACVLCMQVSDECSRGIWFTRTRGVGSCKPLVAGSWNQVPRSSKCSIPPLSSLASTDFLATWRPKRSQVAFILTGICWQTTCTLLCSPAHICTPPTSVCFRLRYYGVYLGFCVFLLLVFFHLRWVLLDHMFLLCPSMPFFLSWNVQVFWSHP